MCLIILKNENKPLVSHEMIEEVWIDNPHGAGIIFKRHNSKSYHMIKGLMSELELHQAIKQLNLTDKDFIAYHLRWATSGEIDQRTTHPFIVHEDVGKVNALSAHNSDKTLYVMHNGVIHDLNDRKAKVSDTIRFVSEYLAHLSMHDLFNSEVTKQLVEKFIDGSRLFLAHSNYGRITYGEWHEHGEYLISKPYDQATKSSMFNKLPKYNYDFDWWSTEAKDNNQLSIGFNNSDEKFCDWCGMHGKVKYNNAYNGNVCADCQKEFVL